MSALSMVGDRDVADVPGTRSEMVKELNDWIESLNNAERMGAEKDEPEGVRYIQISSTLADGLVIVLDACQSLMGGPDG